MPNYIHRADTPHAAYMWALANRGPGDIFEVYNRRGKSYVYRRAIGVKTPVGTPYCVVK